MITEINAYIDSVKKDIVKETTPSYMVSSQLTLFKPYDSIISSVVSDCRRNILVTKDEMHAKYLAYRIAELLKDKFNGEISTEDTYKKVSLDPKLTDGYNVQVIISVDVVSSC